MMPSDLISVLIPAYNVEKYLDRCLTSVEKQTYQNMQIIVVDDGSTDGTYAVAKKHADQDPRILLLQKTNEKNISKTRNFLLDHVQGKYVAWIDSDDSITPNYLEVLYRALTLNQADLTICRFTRNKIKLSRTKNFSDQKLQARTKVYEQDMMFKKMVFGRGLLFSLWCNLYRTDLMRDLRFPEEALYGEDFLFNSEYIKRCQRIATVNHVAYYWSLRRGSEMHQRFCQKHLSFADVLLKYTAQEDNPLVQETVRAWTAFTCCGFIFLVRKDKKLYPEEIEKLRMNAHIYKKYLFQHDVARWYHKGIVRLGLATWCRPKKERKKHG